MKDLIRLNVNLNPETAEALRDQASKQGISITETIRRCIAVYAFIRTEHGKGNRVIIERSDGSHRREMVIM